MMAAAALRQTFTSLGYKAANVIRDYRFAAVHLEGAPVVAMDAAVFFDEPPSYRNAAIGIVRASDEEAPAAIEARRSLGAPFFIAIDNSRVSAWVVVPDGVRKVDAARADEWEIFVAAHRAKWEAQAVRRAKAVQLRVLDRQQLLFDPSVVYTIQGQVQRALSELLEGLLQRFVSPGKSQLSMEQDYRILFPLVFRMLAAKILFDREDARTAGVDPSDVKAVVDFVNRLYSLPTLSLRWTKAELTQLQAAWQMLRAGLYVRNIAADDLAFVYENALITPETRRDFGTHSTPASVAEYMVRSLDLPADAELQKLRVYEPFAGSCVFLTAAMRRFKELLPPGWSTATQHQHLVSYFAASELDQFACEIARLSLILADYPNANGWLVHNEDLFDGASLDRRLAVADVVLCNPPFESFDLDAQARSTAGSVHKPVEALSRFLNARPRFLGVVMPDGFGSHHKYRDLVGKVLATYKDVELLTLPEGTFAHASVGAVALIAQNRREPQDAGPSSVRRAIIRRQDLAAFERNLQPSAVTQALVPRTAAPGLQLLDPLQQLWEYLNSAPKLGEVADIHRGIEWDGDQSLASTSRPGKGKKAGLHRIRDSLTQFRVLDPVYLNVTEGTLRRGAAITSWHLPKVVCSAVRLSRGPWRLAAAVDTRGLYLSQQFFGIWPKISGDGLGVLEAIAAVLNSPLANAFSSTHDPDKRLRVSVINRLPLPVSLDVSTLQRLIAEYADLASREGPLFGATSQQLSDALMAIDAAVLAAYDLPPKLEKALLAYVGSSGRPCGHRFDPYPGLDQPGAIPLKQRLTLRSVHVPLSQSAWARILAPLPEDMGDIFEAV
jgi:hypothetical protein